jgi:hypothetical protein
MRQLLVGNTNAAASYTNGVLASGTVDVQKQDPAGNAISLAPTDTYAGVKKIRFVQGTPEGKNIFSPWIDGKNISVWKGQSYSAQVPAAVTHTVTTPPTAAGEVTVKLIERNPGQAQFKRKSVTIQVAASETVNSIALKIVSALTGYTTAQITSFGNAFDMAIVGYPTVKVQMVTVAGAAIKFTGTTFSLSLDTELSNFEVASEGMDGSNSTTFPATSPANPSLGYGSAEVLSQYEKSLQGDRSFYNRIMQPNTPPSYIDTATPLNYVLYSIVAENGSVNQIKGVDNVRNITIAVNTAASTLKTDFQNKLNLWMGSVPGSFANVTL